MGAGGGLGLDQENRKTEINVGIQTEDLPIGAGISGQSMVNTIAEDMNDTREIIVEA